jgi:hypothetical protein
MVSKELEKEYPQINEIPISGFYSEKEFLWLIKKQENWSLDKEKSFLHFGNAGCDGIQFGLRSEMKGIWAFYPIENEYIKKAETISEFIQGWLSSKIYV